MKWALPAIALAILLIGAAIFISYDCCRYPKKEVQYKVDAPKPKPVPIVVMPTKALPSPTP